MPLLNSYWEKLVACYESDPYIVLGAAILALLLLLWLVRKVTRRKPKRVKAFSDNTGSVYVSIHAITDLIRATCEHIDGISKPRVHLRQKKGVTHLELRLRLESGSRIREIRNAIRDHLKQTLETNLGFDHLGSITVVIDEYKPGPLDAAAVTSVRRDPPADPLPDPEPRAEDETHDTPEDHEDPEPPSREEPDKQTEDGQPDREHR